MSSIKKRSSSEEKSSGAEDGQILTPETLKEAAYRRDSHTVVNKEGVTVNAAGYEDQLQRQYGLLSICGLALTIDNAWVAFAGSLSIAVLNGGPAGILYEFIVACVYYAFIGASIAELASAIPSSGGVYHWASVTGGARYGRVLGFFTGWLNFFGWIFDVASIATIPANVCVQMYICFHPDFVPAPWHTYVAFLIITWLCTAFNIGLFLVIVGGLVTIIVCAAMPAKHATNSFVWGNFEANNLTGWSGGIAFITGVLNGAFTIGTPDAVTHLAEELPNPKVDLPKAVFAQVGLGFLTTFCYGIAAFYAVNNLDAVVNSSGTFPIAEIYQQATGSAGGTFGLLLIIFLSVMICTVGTLLMVGRLWWVLARDNATPFASVFARVNGKLSCPVEATLLCAVLTSAFGAIQIGSATAFTDLVGSFIILTTISYFLAFFPHLLTKRQNIPPGPFWMGKFGFAINGIACVLIVFFNIMFCFPFGYPVDPIDLMNWNSVILVGCTLLTTAWWFIHGSRKYPGPKLAGLYLEGVGE
ncbi:hypothetical protein LTR53_005591 [Teratosphaeriaceae sp. CCFEE 6253]|nr:hypothetical protein LTR53_005591 [Teratosphaeriaceae sp. CCFEE 6253]